ncbi:hypothetical protein FOPE_10800 [Fonsecaea pedrosoi]|nr:hypothetical protein FOPE_10800 [Fonsecaea pedrosoi]
MDSHLAAHWPQNRILTKPVGKNPYVEELYIPFSNPAGNLFGNMNAVRNVSKPGALPYADVDYTGSGSTTDANAPENANISAATNAVPTEAIFARQGQQQQNSGGGAVLFDLAAKDPTRRLMWTPDLIAMSLSVTNTHVTLYTQLRLSTKQLAYHMYIAGEIIPVNLQAFFKR